MSGEPAKPFDPSLLLEASRVMNAAGPDYDNAARLVSDWALDNAARADPKTRAQIIGDAASLRLRKPGHFEEALKLLDDIDSKQVPDDDGRLHILRALANGQKYKSLKLGGETDPGKLDPLRAQIRKDLTFAFDKDKTLRHDNRHYWEEQPATGPRPAADDVEDDLRAVFNDDEHFRDLVAEPKSGSEVKAPGGQNE